MGASLPVTRADDGDQAPETAETDPAGAKIQGVGLARKRGAGSKNA